MTILYGPYTSYRLVLYLILNTGLKTFFDIKAEFSISREAWVASAFESVFQIGASGVGVAIVEFFDALIHRIIRTVTDRTVAFEALITGTVESTRRVRTGGIAIARNV